MPTQLKAQITKSVCFFHQIIVFFKYLSHFFNVLHVFSNEKRMVPSINVVDLSFVFALSILLAFRCIDISWFTHLFEKVVCIFDGRPSVRGSWEYVDRCGDFTNCWKLVWRRSQLSVLNQVDLVVHVVAVHRSVLVVVVSLEGILSIDLTHMV